MTSNPEMVKRGGNDSDAHDIVVFGAGGYARSAAEIALGVEGFAVHCFVVPDGEMPVRELGSPHIGESEYFAKSSAPQRGIVAIGDGAARLRVVERILREQPGFNFEVLVHPSAQVAPSAFIGAGSIVLANSVVATGAKVGQHVMIYTNVTVEHDCVLEDFSSLAPGVSIGGDVLVGAHSFIGIGSVLKHGVRIGPDTVVGANSTVLEDQPGHSVVAGTPARVVGSRRRGQNFL